MKKQMKNKIFHGLAAFMLLPLMGACSQDAGEVMPQQPADQESTELVPVTLRFATEGADMSTRGELDGTETGSIGEGGMIDMLVFAIYDSEGTLLNYQVDGYKSLTINGRTIQAGTGQNIMKWEDAEKGITLDFDLRKTYQIAAWAQSSKCNAYNTQDLRNVTVSYAGAVNNDESRDAFCKSLTFDGNVNELKVILRRPFAQINVGTTGADYKNNRLIPGGTYYDKSTVTLSGAATKMNVLTDVISSEGLVEATFSSATIPAYYNISSVPTDDDKLLQTEGEQFLQIHLEPDSDSEEFLAYKTGYPTKDEEGKYLTEEFKYLSMCYVLVPTATQENNTVLPNFKVTFHSYYNREDNSVALTNLPVRRNYRTNILGGLYYTDSNTPGGDGPGGGDNPGGGDGPDNPDDPDNPDEPIDDPTSLFNSVSLQLEIKCDYFNNYNCNINGEEIK